MYGIESVKQSMGFGGLGRLGNGWVYCIDLVGYAHCA
jgi:hypothetical protein